MNKKELTVGVKEKLSMTEKDAASVVNAVFEEIEASLERGEAVQLIGFGTFSVKERAAREGRNPSTGEPITIPASKAVAFKQGRTLKEKINK